MAVYCLIALLVAEAAVRTSTEELYRLVSVLAYSVLLFMLLGISIDLLVGRSYEHKLGFTEAQLLGLEAVNIPIGFSNHPNSASRTLLFSLCLLACGNSRIKMLVYAATFAALVGLGTRSTLALFGVMVLSQMRLLGWVIGLLSIAVGLAVGILSDTIVWQKGQQA